MMLSGKMINPGELRTKVTLQSRSTTKDAGGFVHDTYSTVVEVFVRWINAHGNEVWQSMTTQAVVQATVLMRYRSDIDHTWRILKGGVPYQIVSLDDIQERHEYIEVNVQRIAEG